jgi:hypothetical protein
MSGWLRRVQSFVSLEFRPASDGVAALRYAVAPPGAPNGDPLGADSESDLGMVK